MLMHRLGFAFPMGAVFVGAVFVGAVFVGATFVGATFVGATFLVGGRAFLMGALGG
jgi:uncharacterized protein YjbI with pentapeptide repeats